MQLEIPQGPYPVLYILAYSKLLSCRAAELLYCLSHDSFSERQSPIPQSLEHIKHYSLPSILKYQEKLFDIFPSDCRRQVKNKAASIVYDKYLSIVPNDPVSAEQQKQIMRCLMDQVPDSIKENIVKAVILSQQCVIFCNSILQVFSKMPPNPERTISKVKKLSEFLNS